jgi:hypothetical protein
MEDLFKIGIQTTQYADLHEALEGLHPFDFMGLNLYHPLLAEEDIQKCSSSHFASDLSLKSHGRRYVMKI